MNDIKEQRETTETPKKAGSAELTGYPSIDKPWLRYYRKDLLYNEMPKCSAYHMLYENNKTNLNDTALIYFGRKIKYGTFFETISQAASSLHTLGVVQGDVVTLQVLNMPQTVAIFYAINRLGAIANLVYVTSETTELHEILINTDSKIYITYSDLWTKRKEAIANTKVENVLILDFFDEADYITKLATSFRPKKKTTDCYTWNRFLKIGSQSIEVVDNSDLPAAMVYTSGTTGKSKACVLTNENLNALVWQYQNSEIELCRGDLFMNSLPSFIAFGLVFAMHMPLCIGIREIIILDPTPMNAGKYFAKYKPNYFVNGKAGIMSIMNNSKVQKMRLDFVKIWAVGGESISTSFEENVNSFLKERGSDSILAIGYGMTELSATVVTSSPKVSRIGTVGIPLPATNIKIVEPETQRELPYDEEGEICIYSPTIMKEYYKQPEETSIVLKHHDDGLSWIHTGDIGKISSDGFLSVVGRIKRIIEIRKDGIYHKLFPKLIEDRLEKVAGIKSVAIVGREKEGVENELITFVVKEDGYDDKQVLSALERYAASCLESWERPDEYHFISEMPRLPSGKVDFISLKKAY